MSSNCPAVDPAVPIPTANPRFCSILWAIAEAEVHDTCLWTSLAVATGAQGNSTALVGAPETVARAMLEYYKLGATSLLIRGYDPRPDAIQYGEELIQRVREKESDAWTEFFDVYRPLLVAYVRKRGVLEHDAADVVQDRPRHHQILVQRRLQLRVAGAVRLDQVQADVRHRQQVFEQPAAERVEVALRRRQAPERLGVAVQEVFLGAKQSEAALRDACQEIDRLSKL